MLTSFFTRKFICRYIVLFFVLLMPAAASASQQSEAVWNELIRVGDIDKALDSFGKILEDDPTDALAHAGIGMLQVSRKTERESLDSFLKALEYGHATPQATLYLFEAMDAASEMEDREKFIKRLDEILEIEDLSPHLRDSIQATKALILKHMGRWDDAEKAYSKLNFLTGFWYCGPFDNAEKGGHDRVFDVETNLDLNAEYEGRHRKVHWRPLKIQPYDGYIDLHAMVSPSHESSAYLVTWIETEEEQSCRLAFGHGGALKAWLNGKLITDVKRYHGVMPDQVNVDTRLDKGRNTLLIKVSSGESGKFGAFVRAIPENNDKVKYLHIPKKDQKPDLSEHTPLPNQESPAIFNQEPISLQQLHAVSEAKEAPVLGLFYVLLLKQWDVSDENDQSMATILTKLNTMFTGNPFLMRLLGDVEKQDNRKRLAYSKALEYDLDDRAAFLSLLNYYRRSPYATKGLELIRHWEEFHDLPVAARLEKARILHSKGLREAAVELLKSIQDSAGIEAKKLLLNFGRFAMTHEEQLAMAKEILKESPLSSSALNRIRNHALQESEKEKVQELLVYERRQNPFSITGTIDLVHKLLTKEYYERALEEINEALIISPDDYELHRLAAVAHHALGHDAESLQELNLALQSKPSDPWCLNYKEFLRPEEENYASPYLEEWQTIEIPDSLDISKANFVTLLHQEIIKVHPNGNASETVREAIKILTDTGVRMQRVRGVYYEEGREEVRIIKARVWKPDGTYIDAPAPQHRSTSSASDAADRLYQDYNVAIIQFPALEKGSVLELEYEKKKTVENIYADYFGHIYYVGSMYLEPTVHSEFVLITPKSRDFYWKYTLPNYPESVKTDPDRLMQKPKLAELGNQRVYQWIHRELPTIPREPLMPSVTEIIPYIKISTFKSWSDMTEWYWNLMKDQLISGPVVKERVDKVVEEYKSKHGMGPEDELSKWDKVKAVNAWVNTGVRYLGLEFGIHGYKPHKVDEICNAQYGDCKDKAVLAIAMLEELGVDAHFVILRTTHLGEIDYDLPSLGIFNHAIYYVPEVQGEERWIDGTATFFGASELPSGDTGANSLIVKPGGDYEFKRIPYTSADDNGGVYTTVLTLDADGNAEGYRAAEFRGLYNPVVRNTYENSAKAKESIDQVLTGNYPGSESSNIKLSDMDDYDTPESLSYEMKIPELGNKQGNTMIIPSTVFDESISQRYAHLSKREYDLVLHYPWTRTNIQKLTLPEGYAQVDLPEDHELKTDFGSYTRTCTLNDGVVEIKEEIVFKPIRVKKERYQDFREFCRLIDLYQDEKITLKMEE